MECSISHLFHVIIYFQFIVAPVINLRQNYASTTKKQGMLYAGSIQGMRDRMFGKVDSVKANIIAPK